MWVILSSIISIMLSVFIIFRLKIIWHMIVYPVQVLEMRILCLGQNVDERRSYSLISVRENTCWGFIYEDP